MKREAFDWREAAFPVLALAVTALAYAHLVGAYFWADDFLYLYLLNDGRLLELLLTPHGGHVQPFRNLFFALYHALFGVRAELYYAAVLATHLLNTLLLYGCVRRATGSAMLACFGAALWSTNPLAEGSLGWFSVYGHVLVGTLTLWVMWRVLRASDQDAALGARGSGLAGQEPGLVTRGSELAGPAGGECEPPAPSPQLRSSRIEPIAWYLATLFASLSFGTGIGIALAMPAVVALWLPGPRFRRLRWALWTLPIMTLALYVFFHRLYSSVTGSSDPTMNNVPRLLLTLWWTVPAMTAHLLAYATMALAAGPYPLLTDPRWPVYIGGAVAAAAAAATALRAGPRGRRLLAGALLLSAGAYAAIAIGRAPLLTATMRWFAVAVPWTRYHYAGTIGLALAICLIVQTGGRWLAVPRPLATGLFGLWLALVVTGLVRNPITTIYHADVRAEVRRMNERIAAAAAASPDTSRVFVDNVRFSAWGMNTQHHDFPGLVGGFIAFNDSDVVDGRQVYFVERNQRVVTAARARPSTRSARLLVTPEERDRLEAGR